MAQFLKGDTFADGQQLTATRLNQLVDSATLIAGAITDQTNITANTVASGDSILLYDLSATALREANVSDVLGSNVPVTTSVVTAGANNDILITPNDATIVVGIPYVSANGLTVVATTPTAHGLTVGQVVLISAASSGYNGTFKLTAVTSTTFTYVQTTAATAGSGSFSYIRKGTVKNTGNQTISGNLYVDGTFEVNGVQNGAVTQTGAVTQSGTVNVTGAIQYDGIVVYGMYSKATSTLPSVNFNSFTDNSYRISTAVSNWLDYSKVVYTETFVVPDKEIWEVNLISSLYNDISGQNYAYSCNVVSTINSVTTTTVIGDTGSIGLIRYTSIPHTYNAVLSTGTHVIKIGVIWISGTANSANTLYCSSTTSPSIKTITKFKTA